jgi:hypothetical protein
MRTPIAAALTATIAIVLLPATAYAIEIHQHDYVDRGPLIREVVTVVDVAPRDSDDDGVANQEDECPKVAAPGGCPPEPEPPIDASSVSTAAPATTSYAPAPTSSGGCPSYMAGEASSPSAVNADSQAAGCFQVIPSTAAAHGCAPQAGAALADQVECAQRICATSGDGAWVAADPCSYVGTEP